MAFYARTNELETYWSHYECEDPDCPGKHRSTKPFRHNDTWTALNSGHADSGYMRKRLKTDEYADNR